MFCPDIIFPLKPIDEPEGAHVEIVDPFQVVVGEHQARLRNVKTVCPPDIERKKKAGKNQLQLWIVGIGVGIFSIPAPPVASNDPARFRLSNSALPKVFLFKILRFIRGPAKLFDFETRSTSALKVCFGHRCHQNIYVQEPGYFVVGKFNLKPI